jgi:hypothetical protein
LWTFCSGWSWTMILLISTSWVASITGVSYCTNHKQLLSTCPADEAEADHFSGRTPASKPLHSAGCIGPRALSTTRNPIWKRGPPSG